MHMIDVVQKLKEIAESGYDNEDIQRGITAANKHQVTEDVQSEYQDLLKSMAGKNERARTKLLGDFMDKHSLPGMYDPESGYYVYMGNDGPEISGYGNMKSAKALAAKGLLPDVVRKRFSDQLKDAESNAKLKVDYKYPDSGRPTRPSVTSELPFGKNPALARDMRDILGLDDKAKGKTSTDYSDTNSDIGQGEDPSKPNKQSTNYANTNSDTGAGEDPNDTVNTGPLQVGKVDKLDIPPPGTGYTGIPTTAAGGNAGTNSDIGAGEDPGWGGFGSEYDKSATGQSKKGRTPTSGKYNRNAIKMEEIEEVYESEEENTALEDILRLAGRSGVLGMNKPVSIVAESLELEEGSMKDMMHAAAEDMELKDFIEYSAEEFGMSKEGAEEFWQAINGEIDEAEVQECDAVEEEAVEETVEVPVSTLSDLMRLAGFTNYQEKVEEYANDPAEEYMDAEEQLIGLSGGMNGPKKMYPAAAGGDNPMDQEPREIEEVAEAEEDFTTSFYKKYDAFLESLNKDN